VEIWENHISRHPEKGERKEQSEESQLIGPTTSWVHLQGENRRVGDPDRKEKRGRLKKKEMRA